MCVCVLVAQSCPTLCDPVDRSLPGSSIHGILQARILEWVAISFSNAGKWKVKVKSLSRARPSATPWTADFQAPPSMGFSRQEYWSGVPLPSPTHIYTCKLYIYNLPQNLHLRIYPTVIAASVQNDLCIKLFILAVLVIIQEEQSQLLVENWLNSVGMTQSSGSLWVLKKKKKLTKLASLCVFRMYIGKEDGSTYSEVKELC